MRMQALTATTLKLRHRLFYYLLIGGTSALTHIFIVFQLVSLWQTQPLIANIIAFLIAFNVSFLGHKYLTFSQLQDDKQLSLPHFFLVASSAGLLNEFLYYLALKFTPLNYLVALILVLGLVSLYSYLISRHWACR